MEYPEKTKAEIIKELRQLKKDHAILKASFIISTNEKKLAQNNFQMLFEQSLVGMALADHETGRFLSVNKAVLLTTGYTEQEFLDLNYWDITPREYESQEIQQIEELNLTGRFGPYLKEYIRKDGTRYPISISGALYVDLHGKKVVWGIIQDITERIKAEKTIAKQNLELKKLNEDKDRFITIIAHDLKSPFSTVLGLLDLLNSNTSKYSLPEIEELLSLITQAAHNTSHLLDDILHWVKANTDNIAYKPEIVNFEKLFAESIKSLHPNSEAKGITINNFASKEAVVFGDKNMLKTIVRNIVSNAIKFNNNNGHISAFLEQTNNGQTITIADTGIGMSAATLNSLFDISSIMSTTGTNNEKGSGLGLLICKELIEKQGGTLWAESDSKTGTKIKFTLPTEVTVSEQLSEPITKYISNSNESIEK
ncbi:hypothetical protein FFWV33_18300 [Flavobacterium faecale]|uniref:histidine kinase n=1 Tax=Flavobacterium faecale TaxID=1355330 RepID=A0A2S1LHS6_9FLAO|nr:PAS domain-containing sensor histidine kinase [Flavobacterium faecale]AWG23342.1 hypothetical protein FFWV33_18300 [Flavobacterium faecale]